MSFWLGGRSRHRQRFFTRRALDGLEKLMAGRVERCRIFNFLETIRRQTSHHFRF